MGREGETHRSHERPRHHRRVHRSRDIDPPYSIHHLAQLDLTRDFQPPPIFEGYSIGVLMKHHQITLSVTLEICIVINMRHSCSPGGKEMPRDFGESVFLPVIAALVLHDGDAFHDVGDGDLVTRDGDVDGGGGRAVGGDFAKGAEFEGVDDDLIYRLSMSIRGGLMDLLS